MVWQRLLMARRDALVADSPRLLSVLTLAVVPWTVVFSGGIITLVFPWGMAGFDPFTVTWLHEYLSATKSLPRQLEAWPISAFLYALALASTIGGVVTGVEDRRVTGGLLVIAGISHLSVSSWVLGTGRIGIPVGTVLSLALAWWFHAEDLRRAVNPGT